MDGRVSGNYASLPVKEIIDFCQLNYPLSSILNGYCSFQCENSACVEFPASIIYTSTFLSFLKYKKISFPRECFGGN